MATLEGFYIPFFPSYKYSTGVATFFMSIIKRLPSDGFTCYMCKYTTFHGSRYVYKTFEILPKNPSIEFIVCKKCAIREHGSKHKKNFDEIFNNN